MHWSRKKSEPRFVLLMLGMLLLGVARHAVAQEPPPLTAGERKCLLGLARDTLHLHLGGKPLPDLKKYPLSPALLQPSGVFVTLKQKKDGELRGCIGYIAPVKPLAEAVIDCTTQSATKDSRFRPMAGSEDETVSIEISVLTPPRRILSVEEIEIGKHGLIITKGPLAGLLLPQVPVEQKWNRSQFLSALCRKAELPDRAWEQGAELYAFSAQVFRERAALHEK